MAPLLWALNTTSIPRPKTPLLSYALRSPPSPLALLVQHWICRKSPKYSPPHSNHLAGRTATACQLHFLNPMHPRTYLPLHTHPTATPAGNIFKCTACGLQFAGRGSFFVDPDTGNCEWGMVGKKREEGLMCRGIEWAASLVEGQVEVNQGQRAQVGE